MSETKDSSENAAAAENAKKYVYLIFNYLTSLFCYRQGNDLFAAKKVC